MFVNTRPVAGNFQTQSTRIMRCSSGAPVMAVMAVMVVILIALILLGCLMDSLSMILLVIPFFWPMLLELNGGLYQTTAEGAGFGGHRPDGVRLVRNARDQHHLGIGLGDQLFEQRADIVSDLRGQHRDRIGIKPRRRRSRGAGVVQKDKGRFPESWSG